MKNKQATLNGFLDQGCTVRGDVVFSDLLRVHGHVVGTMASEHELLVGEGGVVEGEVKVGSLVVAGTVRGTVRVTKKLIVHAGGRVIAEVHTPKLVVDEGGVVDGAVHMVGDGGAPEANP
jgi:cytoskeletal protein CcmA (bactofilin family)